MITLIENIIEKLNIVLSANDSSTIWMWNDRSGVGKSYAAKKYCNDRSDVFYCDCVGDEDFKRSFKVSKAFLGRSRSIQDEFLKYIKKNKISKLIFDIGKSSCSDQFYEIIRNSLTKIIQLGYKINIIFIFDEKNELLRVSSYLEKYFNANILQFLPLEILWQQEDFEELLRENFGNLQIDKIKFDLLNKYSAKNAGLFLKQIQNLKYLKVLERTSDGYIWNGEDIEPYIRELYEDNIEKRYNNLEPKSQHMLLKSSVVGEHFSVKMLQKAFCVSDAISILKNVHIASRLIEFTDNSFANGKFESDNVREFLRKSINEDEYKETCKQLAQYYLSLLDQWPLFAFERIELYQKCSFYKFETGEHESAFGFSLGALGLMYSHRLYSSAISYGMSLNPPKNDLEVDNIIIKYRFLYEVSNRIFDYEQAFKFFKEYLRLTESGKSFSNRYRLGELYYNNGQAETSLNILYELLNDKKTISSASNEQKATLLNFISSVEETLDLNGYEDRYYEALNLAQKCGKNSLYYKILRKANFVEHNEKGLAYLQKAKDYFENVDKIEYALCCHNLATEQLLLSLNYIDDAKTNLDAAIKYLNELDCRQVTYVYNSYAIYYMLKGKYKKAYDYILPQLNLKHEDFTLLALHLNLCTCLRRLGKITEANKHLLLAREINSKLKNNFPFFNICISMQEFMFCLEKKDTITAESLFRKLKEPAKGYSLLKTMQYALGKSGDYDSISKHCGEHKLVLCDLMFWE